MGPQSPPCRLPASGSEQVELLFDSFEHTSACPAPRHQNPPTPADDPAPHGRWDSVEPLVTAELADRGVAVTVYDTD
ncbi:hypothetical protein GCM10009727_03960 [Actinomadura napierensis]|uniref:Uncharacterized protein n=1 Tax=Actinomadura napierensis TaxID=267854 RepID=A0ABP5JNP4_9ACTN